MEMTYGTQPRDLIALAWYSIGFRPRHDLVLVALHDGLAGPGPILRIRLPPRRYEFDVVDQLLRGLRRADPEVNGVIALVLHDELRSARHNRLVALLKARAPGHRLGLLDVIAVSPHGYRSLFCGAGCCPPEGRPLQEVTDSAVSVAMIASGEVLADDEAELIADVMPERPDPPGRPRGRDVVPDGRTCSPGERVAALAAWRAMLAGSQVPFPALARAMADKLLRDAALLCAVPGSGDAPERLVTGESVDVAQAFATPPDVDLANRVRDALAVVARASPRGLRAHPVAALAWLAWWSGHGARARLLALHALQLQPGHALADLIRDLAAVPAPPPWHDARTGPEGSGEQVAS